MADPTEAVKEAIEEQCSDAISKMVETPDGDIWIQMKQRWFFAGDVFAIGQDHGWTPVGLISGDGNRGTFRLVPRDDFEPGGAR